jgi:hypothetical protein
VNSLKPNPDLDVDFHPVPICGRVQKALRNLPQITRIFTDKTFWIKPEVTTIGRRSNLINSDFVNSLKPNPDLDVDFNLCQSVQSVAGFKKL